MTSFFQTGRRVVADLFTTDLLAVGVVSDDDHLSFDFCKEVQSQDEEDFFNTREDDSCHHNLKDRCVADEVEVDADEEIGMCDTESMTDDNSEDTPSPPCSPFGSSSDVVMSSPYLTNKKNRGGNTIAWNNVNVRIPRGRQILDNVSGEIKPGTLACIFGPSGAGKTSLLNVLAGRLVNSKKVKVDIDYTFNGIRTQPSHPKIQQRIAYIEQQDHLLGTATVREAITFSARLRLSKSITDEQLDLIVFELLTELRLLHVADTIIGNQYFRGISGGEMRRVSLAVELVTKPSTLFLDEITSGLDSHSALVVMELCKKITRDEKQATNIIMTIHQPSSYLFDMMDHIILLKQGRVLYQGAAPGVIPFFELRGYPCPPSYNPADFIVEVSQTQDIEVLENSGFFVTCNSSSGSNQHDNKANSSNGFDNNTNHTMGSTRSLSFKSLSSSNLFLRKSSFNSQQLKSLKPKGKGDRVSLMTEFTWLLTRELRGLYRDRHSTMVRFVVFVAGSVFIAIVCKGVGAKAMDSETSFISHVGAVFLLTVAQLISGQLVILDLAETRHVFEREYSTDTYRLLPYVMVRFLMEILIFGTMGLISFLIVFWTIGFQGDFFYILGVLFLMLMCCLAGGTWLGCSTDDPRAAKEFLPFVLLFQMLLSGFFISSDDLPSYIRWAQWTQPLPYAFRLFLREEFKHCLGPPPDDVLEDYVVQLRTHAFCQKYLEVQNATGENDLLYWMVLLGIFIFFRGLAFVLMQRKAMRKKG